MTSKLPDNQGFITSQIILPQARPKGIASFYKDSTFVNYLPPNKHLCLFCLSLVIHSLSPYSSVYQLYRVHAVANIHAKILVDNWYSSG